MWLVKTNRLYLIRSFFLLTAFMTNLFTYYDERIKQGKDVFFMNFNWIEIGSHAIPIRLAINKASVSLSLAMITIFCMIFTCLSLSIRPSKERTQLFTSLDFLVPMMLISVFAKSTPVLIFSFLGIILASFFVKKQWSKVRKAEKTPKSKTASLLLNTGLFPIKIIDRALGKVINFTYSFTMTISGVLSFTMGGSLQRHMTIMVLGFMIFLLLAMLL